VTLLRQGVGPDDPQRSLPTPTFCDSEEELRVNTLWHWASAFGFIQPKRRNEKGRKENPKPLKSQMVKK